MGISAIDMDSAVEMIDDWIKTRRFNYVCVTGVHGIIESWRDNHIRDIHNAAGMVTPDGMPMVWLSRLRGFNHVRRVYGPDLMISVCKRGLESGYRHFFYGGAEGIPELLARKLKFQFPDLQVAGAFSPPFRPLTFKEDRDVVGRINAANPDIVWVGLSTPRQEVWMADHFEKLNSPVMIAVGAAFDFHAGVKKQAPFWIQRSGLEWLFRLATEPRRLWKRYLINNTLFIALMLCEVAGIKFRKGISL